MRRHAPPKPPKAAAPTPSSDEDPFSSCVADFWSRSFSSEVEDASIPDFLTDETKGAKSTSLLLDKDSSHAKQETMGLQQTVKDDLEVAVVNGENQDRSGETLMESAVAVASSKASMQSNDGTIDTSEDSTNDKDDAVVPTTVAASNGIDHKSYLTAKKNQLSGSVDTLEESRAESVPYQAAKKQEEALLEEKPQALQTMRAKKEACRSDDDAQQIANNKVLKEQDESLEAVGDQLKNGQEDLDTATTAKSKAEIQQLEAEQAPQEAEQDNVARDTEAEQARNEEQLVQERTEWELLLEVLEKGKEIIDATDKEVALLDLSDEEQ